jgi:hypothetical protein
MSGVLDVMDYTGGSGGSGTVEGAWGNIYGHLLATTDFPTLSGFTGTHTLAVTWTGAPLSVYAGDYVDEPVNITNTGSVSVTPGQRLGFYVYSGDVSTQSGTVTITDSTAGGAAVGSFNYVVTAP